MNINNSKKHNMKRESRNLAKAHVTRSLGISDWQKKYLELMSKGDGRINISKPAAMSHDYYLSMIYCIDKEFALKIKLRCSEKSGIISHVVVELSKSEVVVKCTLKFYELTKVVKEFHLFEKILN